MRKFWVLMRRRVASFVRRETAGGKLQRFAFWSLCTALALFLLRLIPGAGNAIGAAPWLAAAVWALASLPRLFRWTRWRLLWRLRNRLFVTYLLVGVTPVVLCTLLGAVAAYVLFGQFADFAAVSEIEAQWAQLSANNRALALHYQQLVASLPPQADVNVLIPASAPPEARAMDWMPEVQVGLFLDGHRHPVDFPEHTLPAATQPPSWMHRDFSGLVLQGGKIYFRAVTFEQAGGHRLVVITSLPLDTQFLTQAARGLGRITLLPRVQIAATKKPGGQPGSTGFTVRDPLHAAKLDDRAASSLDSADLGGISGGSLPKRVNVFDIPINFPTTLDTRDWDTGESIAVIAIVRSRPSLLYERLFRQSLLIGGGIQLILILTGILFACLELLAIFFAWRLGRTITQSVAAMYQATREVDQGRFDYRIPVTRQDQLAALSLSFNTMSASVGRLLKEQKEKERLQNELAIAQEVQSNLFPPCDVRLGGLELHGLCRPARTVSGDYYDFLVLDENSVSLALGDISGKGISAALLMASLHSAVRAYRFAGEDILANAGEGTGRVAAAANEISASIFSSPGVLMALLNRHIYRSTQAEKYATLFLGHYDATTRILRYSNGGQLPPLLLRANGSVERLDRGGTVVGLMDNMQYEEGAVTLAPGDLLVAYSDGVTEPESDYGEFGEKRLVDLMRGTNGLRLEEITRRVTAALEDWIGAQEQPDDITLVLARQH
jgi:sigma-B regulation protein RsbU (phosphoserine phosphatase)